MKQLLKFSVCGKPQTKGSKKVVPIKNWTPQRGGMPYRIIEDNPEVAGWMRKVSQAAYDAASLLGIAGRPVYDQRKKIVRMEELIDGPLYLHCSFFLLRPAGHFRADGTTFNATGLRNPYPAVKPDVSKLVRAIEDAMTGVVIAEDSRVVNQFAEKRYCHDPRDVRAEVTLYLLTGESGDANADN